MPCYTDPPSSTEIYRQNTAKLLVYVLKSLGRTPDRGIVATASDCFAHKDYTPELCAELKALSKAELERLAYNAKSKQSRLLADWWEDHQAADARHEAAEKAESDRKAALESAKSKLTKAERKALGLE